MYMVYFETGDADEMFFTTYEEAEHFARLNAGTVLDVDAWKVLARFS